VETSDSAGNRLMTCALAKPLCRRHPGADRREAFEESARILTSHPVYCGAIMLDPDGNKLEVVAAT
jgi:hypothetical protein